MPTDLTKARQLFGTFSKIGAFTFGGGYAMIPLIRREIALIKVRAEDHSTRDEIIQLVNIFRAKIIDVGRESLTVWVFGSESKNTALIQMLTEFGILEIAKTGTIAIERGRSTIYDNNKLQEEYDYGKNVL